MAKICEDFLFLNQKLSDFGDFITVDFNGDSDIPLALGREMSIGETNPYRVEANYFGDKWTTTLPLEIHIIKNPCTYLKQKEQLFTQNEIRKITRWLTSPHYPQWLKFEYSPDDNDKDRVSHYRGWFNDIETYVVGGSVYGLRLKFNCTTPFGYTDYIVEQIVGAAETTVSATIENDSDELNNYCYPQIKITPNSTGQMFICNFSDCKILESGLKGGLSLSYVVETYASFNQYKVKYAGTDQSTPTLLCDGNAIQLYLIDKYGNEAKCTIFYWDETGHYYLVEGGFMYMDVKADLEINIDCQKLLIQDSIGRMITYDEIGIADVDNMYWMRLLNGSNTILVHGDVSATFTYRESRKVGE